MMFSFLIPSDLTSWIITLILGYLVYYLAKFYLRVWSLPPGPTPLPLIGNILTLRGTTKHVCESLVDIKEKYGPVFTFWAGRDPFVFIADFDLAKEAFRKNEFAGRPKFSFSDWFSNEKQSDIAFADYGPRWESLRRVAHAAVRKYAVSDKLAYLVREIVEETVKTIKDKAGDKEIDPLAYIYFIFCNILYSSAFGIRFKSADDPDFKHFKYYMGEGFIEIGTDLAMVEFFPFLKPLYKKFIKLEIEFKKILDDFKVKFDERDKNYEPGTMNTFCDALMNAREEAIAEGKENAPYLTNGNLAMSVFDLMSAGTDTSQFTFKWIVLLMATYPEMQMKMRIEVESLIGDRMPVYEDKDKCHYVNAFISETMRFRNIVPVGIFHKTLVNTKIGSFDIPKDVTVFVFQQYFCWDPKYWPNWDPKKFVPERFLIDGEFNTQKPSVFIPFGIGRRACLGEKLALADLFLVTVNFLQATSGYEIALPGGPGSVELSPEPNETTPDLFKTRKYEIVFKKTK